MTKVLKVVNTTEYRAMEVTPENEQAIFTWFETPVPEQAELATLSDLTPLQGFYVLKHPSGHLSMIHPSDFAADFDLADKDDILKEALGEPTSADLPTAEGGELETTEEWQWRDQFEKWWDAADRGHAVTRTRENRGNRIRSRAKVHVTKAWVEQVV